MADSYTPRMNLPQMADGEQSGYVTYNDLARILDALLNIDVQSATSTTPPGSPAEGQLWYVPVGATGAWAGNERKIAQWYGGQWVFYGIPVNTQMWVIDAGTTFFIDPSNDVPRMVSSNIAALIGLPDNGTLGTGGLLLTGWDEAHGWGTMAGTMNASTGIWTCPGDGIYKVTIHVFGSQGNLTKEESIWLQIIRTGGSNDGTYDVDHESVDTDKTDDRSLGLSFIRGFANGETLQLRMRASAGLGTFDFQACTFEVELVQ